MNVILLILRLLFGPLAPRWDLAPGWDEAAPLAARRDGRVEQRLPRQVDEPSDHPPVAGPCSLAWRAVVRAVGWCGRQLGLTGHPGGN
jgi:hypothetical protein